MLIQAKLSVSLFTVDDSLVFRNALKFIKTFMELFVTHSDAKVWYVRSDSLHLFQTLKDKDGHYLINNHYGWAGEIYGVALLFQRMSRQDVWNFI